MSLEVLPGLQHFCLLLLVTYVFGNNDAYWQHQKSHLPPIPPYSNPFLSVLHQNKALHGFHERWQHPTAGCIRGLD